MKGIREAAMSTESEEKPSTVWPKAKTPSLFDKDFDSDRYDGSYYNPGAYSGKTYSKPQDENIITITLTVAYSKLGVRLDGDGNLVDEIAAEAKAIEIAYDRIEALLGKNYESKFTVSFDASDDYYSSFEVEVTLKPLT